MHYKLNAAQIATPPPIAPPSVILEGKHVALSPLARMDEGEARRLFAELFACSHGNAERESVWEFLPYGKFDNADAMADCYLQMQAANEAQFYAVMHRQSSRPAAGGIVSYLRVQPAAYSAEIGHIWHAAPMQRGRANTESAFLLLQNAFALGYRRVEWKCNALNMKSRLAALRLGFAFEGVFRQCMTVKGKNRDTAWFAIIDKDWPAVRDNMRGWLDSPPGAFSLAQKNLPLVQWSLAAHDSWPVAE